MATVLVIEDNPVNMKLAVLLLHNAGHTALCAVDAETGLMRARAEHPDLILMDCQLPGMDGLTATALLKHSSATAAIPVIALTATATKADQESGRAAGFDAHIAKPLRYQELYAAINILLAKGKPQESLESELPDVASGLQSFREVFHARASVAVDVGVLEGLIGNDPAAILEFQNAFRISAEKIALELKAACHAGQADQAGRQAHKLRSSAHTVGALALGKLCAEMEAAGKAGSTETLAKLLPLFEQELGAVNAFLDALRAAQADHHGRSFM
jgi:CheY-like chemotaxis protein